MPAPPPLHRLPLTFRREDFAPYMLGPKYTTTVQNLRRVIKLLAVSAGIMLVGWVLLDRFANAGAVLLVTGGLFFALCAIGLVVLITRRANLLGEAEAFYTLWESYQTTHLELFDDRLELHADGEVTTHVLADLKSAGKVDGAVFVQGDGSLFIPHASFEADGNGVFMAWLEARMDVPELARQ